MLNRVICRGISCVRDCIIYIGAITNAQEHLCWGQNASAQSGDAEMVLFSSKSVPFSTGLVMNLEAVERSTDHGVGSTDYFSALNIWMFENKFVSLPSHLKTIEPMEVHGSQERCVIQKLQK